MATEPAEDEALADALLVASRALVGVAARSMAPLEGEISLQQYRILVRISDRGPQRITDLARELDLNPSSISRLCDRVEAKRLVRRTPAPDSRREVRVSLTPAGAELVDAVARRRRADLLRIVAELPPRARGGVVRALERFTTAADGDAPDEAWKLGWGR